MAAIHLRVHEARGPALLFERVKGSRFRAASNIFGTLERSEFIFRDTLRQVRQLIDLKNNPIKAIKSPVQNLGAGFSALVRRVMLGEVGGALVSQSTLSLIPKAKGGLGLGLGLGCN